MNVINWHRQKLLLPLFGVVFVYSLNENSNLSIPHLAPCYWTSAFSLYFFCFGLCCWICVPWIVNTWSVTRGSIWIYRHCVNRFFISSGSVWFCFRFWYGFLFFVVFFFLCTPCMWSQLLLLFLHLYNTSIAGIYSQLLIMLICYLLIAVITLLQKIGV